MKSDPFSPRRAAFSIVFFLLLLSQKLAAQIPFVCQDQFFLTFVRPPTSLNEVIINAQNNVDFQTIKSNLGVEVNAAGYRSTDNFIYCIAPQTNQLVRLDANGNATILAALPLNSLFSYFAGDITPDGRYLVVVGTGTLFNGTNVAAELARIDLESPVYATTRVTMTTQALIFDIAFSPITGQLYGYDSNGLRLCRIDENSGAVTFPFPAIVSPGITGSLFFDAFGNLFAYGSSGIFSQTQNRLYQIDTQTGTAQLLTGGAAVEASDGCSCPYTVQLLKTVSRPEAFPCSEIEYTFTIANTSGRTQQGLRLEDNLPSGFTFVSVKSNPLTGIVVSVAGDNRFILNNLEVPTGRHEIVIVVQVGNIAPKVYKNQARLLNLPSSLGGTRVSDDPTTLIKADSTSIQIKGLPFASLDVDKTLCNGADFLQLDAGEFAEDLGTAVKYVWQDGSTKSTFDATGAGNFRAGLIFGCDTVWVNFAVREAGISVELEEDFFQKQLGDSVFLKSIVELSNSQTAFYQWIDPQPGSIRCPTCPETWAQAFDNVIYILQVENEFGCTDTASARVEVFKNYNIFFPNVFKPEGSTEFGNDRFTGFGDPATMVDRLAVYTRWGELVFETSNIVLNDPQLGWDGSIRGKPANPGVYVWMVEVSFLDGKKALLSGDVAVIR